MTDNCCHPKKKRFDWLLWGSLCGISFFSISHLIGGLPWQIMAEHVFHLLHQVWWGLLLGIIMLTLLVHVPKELVIGLLGRHGGFSGLCRATAAGIVLDLCSHGILMVGAKLYERGATTGQVMAFLIASPWNSFSLTLILFALIGIGWTLGIIALSIIIAIITGFIFDLLGKKQILQPNPNRVDLPEDFHLSSEIKKAFKSIRLTPKLIISTLIDGIKESRIVIKWLFFGVLLAAAIRTFVPLDYFQSWFGPTMLGLAATIAAATIVEVCSEGSAPLAADIFNRANAPGNGFAFLMAGVSTDYTEIMILKEATASWKTALFLPLVTLPQIVLMAALINSF